MAYKEFSDIDILKKEISFQKKEKQKDLSIIFITGHLDTAYHAILKKLGSGKDLSLVIQVRGESIGEDIHPLDPLNHEDKELLIKYNINYFCIFDLVSTDLFQIKNEKAASLFGLSSQHLSTYIKTAMSSINTFGVNRLIFLERHARQYFALREFLHELNISVDLSLEQEGFSDNFLRYFHDHEYILSNYSDEIEGLSSLLNLVIKNCRGISKDLIKERIIERLEDEGFVKVTCTIYDPVNSENEFIAKSTRFYLTLEIGGQLYIDDRSFVL